MKVKMQVPWGELINLQDTLERHNVPHDKRVWGNWAEVDDGYVRFIKRAKGHNLGDYREKTLLNVACYMILNQEVEELKHIKRKLHAHKANSSQSVDKRKLFAWNFSNGVFTNKQEA